MPTTTWQKSSYCGEGESCVHIAALDAPPTIHLTESGDPAGTVLDATPTAFTALIHILKLKRKKEVTHG